MKYNSSSLSKCRFILILIVSVFAVNTFASDFLILSGRVKESLGKTDLTSAYVITYDSLGNVSDSISCDKGHRFFLGELVKTSNFWFRVPRVDSTYVFDVVCDKYQPKTVTFTVENIGRREEGREIPIIYLQRAPHKLREVTVTTSKIKFYNKGDTVVYNADAFQLAEGSMLDALIAQLPGVELNENGQIKVNGRFVESLLLNGKEFFDGNNNLMLENIGAYTVKDIQVYDGESKDSRRHMSLDNKKELTMDVRLKREYNMGLILNAQGGYGTEDRYMGRLFASWFDNNSRISLVANANNLNDNRQPGKNDTWTPDMMPSGTREYRMAGLDFNHDSGDERIRESGNVSFSWMKNNSITGSDRVNFLPAGDTYEKSFGDSRARETAARISNYIGIKHRQMFFSNALYGQYQLSRNADTQLGGSFDTDQSDLTFDILDAIYSDGSPQQLESIINRSKTRTDTWSRLLYGRMRQSFTYSIPKSQDAFLIGLEGSYRSEKNNVWRDYDINYGSDPSKATRRRQYTDNTPNHDLGLSADVYYRTNIRSFYLGIRYLYEFEDRTRDSYMFALDRLNDMGVYGILPADYTDAFDPKWSHTSRSMTNRHTVTPNINFFKRFDDGRTFTVMFSPSIVFNHRHFDYHRDGRDYPLSTGNNYISMISPYEGMISYRFGCQESQVARYRNELTYEFTCTPSLPELTDMIDIVNDADPLNVYLGNPDLRPQYTIASNLRWRWTPFSHNVNNTMLLHYSTVSNSLTRGYTYDTNTGTRYNRVYNVDGNWSAQIHNSLSWQFGATRQFTLSSDTEGVLSGYTDMIGVDSSEPELSKVRYRSISQNVKFAWQLGAQSLQLRCDFINRHTTSRREGFNNMDAYHVNYGLSGVFRLPAGFGISTDFMCYTRRGYGSSFLDTTDPIWNTRLSYTPERHSRWLFTVDAFDMLHKLSNVHYAVTASGRTVSYSNALPRYILATVQYRFSIQPKRP